jgi:hypothetical protein
VSDTVANIERVLLLPLFVAHVVFVVIAYERLHDHALAICPNFRVSIPVATISAAHHARREKDEIR